MKFGKRKSEKQMETFVGNFRVSGSENTIKELQKNVVVRHRDTEDGKRIFYYGNGDIVIKTFNELIEEKVAIIRENDARRNGI